MNSATWKKLEHAADARLNRMTLDEKIGHLLCWDVVAAHLRQDPAKVVELTERYHLGSLFVYDWTSAQISALTAELDRRTPVPVLISSDLEHGAGPAIPDGVEFPFQMAVGAADDEALAETMGRAAARQGAAAGVQWTYSPVVDINYNRLNPIVNVRAYGDNHERVARLAAAVIRGLQRDDLMAATAKHFPGDGVDDRDQHICTTINSYSLAKWRKTFGKVWQRVIREDVMSIMAGHIALPCVDPGEGFVGGVPATLSHKIQVEFLKQELGFRGCLVSDAIPMIGISSHVKADELAVWNVATGSDVVLFCEPARDFPALKRAVETGVITEARLHDAVRRVLIMKARLGSLETRRQVPAVSSEELAVYQGASRAIADKAVTLSRNMAGIVPLRLNPGTKVLTITLKYNSGTGLGQDQGERYRDLTVVDEELRRRGLVVDHACNDMSLARKDDYEAVFVNVKIVPHCLAGTVRMVGHLAFQFWNSVLPGARNLVITAFGNPYLADEIPSAKTMLLMYDCGPDAQRAAVATWLGEQRATGRSPVELD
ncbi:MAG: glycoside hydrolase family 3 N-terminal domain-containing protein [bacterium]